MSYVIINIETDKFVSAPGSERSYTSKLQNARVFSSSEEAQRHCCSNERVLPLREAVQS